MYLAYLPAPNFPAAVCTMSSPAMAFATFPTMASTGAVHGNLSLTASAKQSCGFGKSIQLPVALTSMLAVAARDRRRAKAPPIAQMESRPSAVLTNSPAETYEELVQASVNLKNESWQKTFHAALMGGAYVGMACLLSFTLGGNMFRSYTAQMAVFAALFPVNLLLILQSGGQLFSGNSATMAMGVLEKKVTLKDLMRNWSIAFAGNMIGCLLIGVLANYTGILTGGASEMIVSTTMRKCSAEFGPTLVKGIMCNWLVCMAVWLCTMAKGLGGKMIGAWFPISMFVAIGFEHSVTNMFLLPAGILSGAPVSVLDVLVKNLIPVTIGNAIAGALVVAVSMSFSFGRLGRQRN